MFQLKIKNQSLFAYTVSHFFVDFSCLFFLYRWLLRGIESGNEIAFVFLLYNVLAFGLQPLLGYFCDVTKNLSVGRIGCVFIFLGLVLHTYFWPALFLVAVGNACFHVAGGIDCLSKADGKLTRGGIFVSTGAIGVSLGIYLGGKPDSVFLIPQICMVVVIILLETSTERTFHVSKESRMNYVSKGPFWLLLFCVLIAIVIRAYGGNLFPMNWKDASMVLLPGVAAGFGKAVGGFLADRFGARRTGCGTLLLSLPLLIFGQNIAWISLLGIVLFNVMMPISLGLSFSLFPEKPGLAFGLTTLALLCGTIPIFFFSVPSGWKTILLAILIIFASIVTFVVMKGQKKGEIHDSDE